MLSKRERNIQLRQVLNVAYEEFTSNKRMSPDVFLKLLWLNTDPREILDKFTDLDFVAKFRA